jgi:hypothetical protein
VGGDAVGGSVGGEAVGGSVGGEVGGTLGVDDPSDLFFLDAYTGTIIMIRSISNEIIIKYILCLFHILPIN